LIGADPGQNIEGKGVAAKLLINKGLHAELLDVVGTAWRGCTAVDTTVYILPVLVEILG
jgi:hypothetical protein